MRWGYARVSTLEQSAAGQVDALAEAGVSEARIVIETASGATPRPLLAALVDRLREGDELVVVRLDRLGRNARDLHELVGILRDIGVRLRSLQEGLDGTGPMADFLINVLIAVSQWERENIREKSRQGIIRARARGVHMGRRPKLTPVEERTALAWKERGWTLSQIAESLHCSRATVGRALRKMRGEQR